MADKLTLDRQAMKDRSTAHLRVYVGGLTESATIEDLYEHFIAYGEVAGIVINRGFGFVQFIDEASAQKAINMGDGSVFQGKSLNVRTAQTNTDKRRDDYSDKPPMEYPASEEVSEDYNESFPGEEDYSQHGESEGVRGVRGRGAMRGGRGRPNRGRPTPFRERSPVAGRGGEWNERMSFDRFARPDYPRALPVPERNDCEIIVVSKALTEYAEYIEDRLKRLGVVVDLLFPMEHVAIGKVLGNIASRGCLYAILVMPENQEHRSLTLTILHGLPQEHRDMPIEDALRLMSRNFQEVQRGGAAGREAVQALLGQLADGRALTALQYEKVIEYLKEKKEQQIKIELGEPTAPADKQVDLKLQQRILTILDKTVAPSPAPAKPTPAAPEQNKLLNDPSVRKALDSILQKFV